MDDWVDWDGGDKAPDAGHPMVYQVEFTSAYFGYQPIVWSDWIDWTHVKRYRLPEDATDVFETEN
jgi:hypothetical protein